MIKVGSGSHINVNPSEYSKKMLQKSEMMVVVTESCIPPRATQQSEQQSSSQLSSVWAGFQDNPQESHPPLYTPCITPPLECQQNHEREGISLCDHVTNQLACSQSKER